MTRNLWFLSIALLLINGVSASIGGWSFITDPSGGSLHIPLSWLEHSPFQNFLIPGIVLFVTNGLSSLAIAVFIVAKPKSSSTWVLFQGSILTGWIIIQMIMLQTVEILHLVFGGLGALLMLLGYILEPESGQKK